MGTDFISSATSQKTEHIGNVAKEQYLETNTVCPADSLSEYGVCSCTQGLSPHLSKDFNLQNSAIVVSPPIKEYLSQTLGLHPFFTAIYCEKEYFSTLENFHPIYQ